MIEAAMCCCPSEASSLSHPTDATERPFSLGRLYGRFRERGARIREPKYSQDVTHLAEVLKAETPGGPLGRHGPRLSYAGTGTEC